MKSIVATLFMIAIAQASLLSTPPTLEPYIKSGITDTAADNLRNAYTYYQQCLLLSTTKENTYDILYRLGLVTHELSKVDQQFTWSMAQGYYMQAYALCPGRVEPLVMMARYYIEHDYYELAFVFARRACELPIPAGAYAMIERDVYTFYRFEALSNTASHFQAWELGLGATKQALKVRPCVQQLHQQLCYYHEQLTLQAGRAIEI